MTLKENNNKIFSSVLTVGPQYENHEGGIGAMLESYSQFFPVFKFLPTHKTLNSNFKKLLYFLKQVFKLIKILNRDKIIKIVHIHGSHSGSFFRKFVVFFIAKKVYKKRIIYHLNSSSFQIFYDNASSLIKPLIKYLFKNCDLVLCVSSSWKEYYEKTFHINHVRKLNNVVLNPLLRANFENLSAMPIRFIFLGKIGDRKGLFDLIDVIIKHKETYEGKLILSVGGNGEVEKLKAMIDEFKLQNIVEFEGWITGDKKKDLLQHSHVYILPSYNEGLPISILEAMSYGLPIVSTTAGGIGEVVKNNYNGFICNPGDKEMLTKILNDIIKNPEHLKKFSANSLSIVQNYFPEKIMEELINIYTSLLNQNH